MLEPHHYLLSDFTLEDIERKGGMAVVSKAVINSTNVPCALKRTRPDASQEFGAASFEREVRALTNLEHKNIVRLLGVGTDGTQRVIVLEWLEETLRDKLEAMGPYDWTAFYEQIGRPLLIALQYAHGRGVAHRDLKPLNVMFTRTGTPKITDFGIARELDSVRLGLTFAGANSHPWTPAEIDNGAHTELRDLYSWAAICVACLTGRQDFVNVSQLRAATEVLGATAPKDHLLACLSDNLYHRPSSATELLWDIDDFHRERLGSSELERVIGIELLPDAHANLEEFIPEKADLESRIADLVQDFAQGCEICLLPQGDLELAGRTLSLRTSRATDSPWLMVKSVRAGGSEASVEPNMRAKVRLVERVNAASYAMQSRSSLNFLLEYLSTASDRLREELRKKDEERYLLMLQDIVSARIRALRQLPAISYSQGHWENGEFSIVLDGDEPPETGEKRLIRSSQHFSIVEVTHSIHDRVFLRTIGKQRGQLPEVGLLEVDTVAQKRSLERQEEAVKAVSTGMAVLPELKRLLLKPEETDAPEIGGRPQPEGLSSDKIHVIDAALGMRQLMVVVGPPGTGKTTLITEVIKQYLREHPKARILISAQTHVAIDHVVLKLRELPDLKGRIVRIARIGDEKVAEAVRDITLEHCVSQWCAMAVERARNFASERGIRIGLNANEVERVVRLEALLLACKRLESVKAEVKTGSASLAAVERDAVNTQATEALETATIATMSVADLETERSRLEENILRLRADLRQLGNDGASLADLPAIELEEWLHVLQGTNEVWKQFRSEIELQVSWIDLLGQLKQFEEAVLRSASVVAGTCVGLGSNDAFTRTRFDLCIVDEASKATATEALVPMARSERFLLVGDPKQLPPFDNGPTDLEDYSEVEAKETLLDHLLPKLPPSCVHQLTHQHRMCKSIGDLVSDAFYSNTLINIRPDSKRPTWMLKKFPKPVIWINTHGFQQRAQGHSYINVGEQTQILEILKQLQHGASRAQKRVEVSVIAGYTAQAYSIDSRIQKSSFTSLEIEVATVDSFQGRETDVTIFSVTLSNKNDFLGFMRSANRLNVALSRPRDLLVIVGDQLFCYNVPGLNPFVRVIDHMDSNPTSCTTINVSH